MPLTRTAMQERIAALHNTVIICGHRYQRCPVCGLLLGVSTGRSTPRRATYVRDGEHLEHLCAGCGLWYARTKREACWSVGAERVPCR